MLRIREQLGKNHIDLGSTLNNLAIMEQGLAAVREGSWVRGRDRPLSRLWLASHPAAG